jgi:hypothetical protein
MTYDFELFKGAAVQLQDIKNSEQKARRIAEDANVKNVWPIYIYDRPDPVFETVDLAKLASRDVADTVGPHVMMQVDKLRAEGFTGEGTRVAVLDSGVSFRSYTMRFLFPGMRLTRDLP